MPKDNEYLSLKTIRINNKNYNYWAIRDFKTNKILGISSKNPNIISMALSENSDNNQLKQLLSQSIANNAKANINIQRLEKMNANLTQQLAKMQITK